MRQVILELLSTSQMTLSVLTQLLLWCSWSHQTPAPNTLTPTLGEIPPRNHSLLRKPQL